MPPFEIVFDWMENGGITEYVRKNPEVDRVGLVSGLILIVISSEGLNVEFRSCGTWWTALTTSTRAT